MLIQPTLLMHRTPTAPPPATCSPKPLHIHHSRHPPKATGTANALTPNATRLQGVHGSTHHPHFMHAWRKACGWFMKPILKFNDKVVLKFLRHHDHYQDLYIPTRLGNVHMLDCKGKGPLPPVVILHGLSASSADYTRMLHRFSKCCERVIAVDMLGHGLSADFTTINEKQFVAAHMEALEKVLKQPTIVLGHSLGGYLAARYAAAHPEKVSGLVLAVPPGGPASQAKRQETITLFEQGSWHDAWYMARRAFPRGWIIWPLLMAATEVRLTRKSLQVLIHSDISQCLLPPAMLQGLKMPVLLFWGDRERVIPAEHFSYFKKNLPRGSTIERVERMGHSELAIMPRRVLRPFQRWASQIRA